MGPGRHPQEPGRRVRVTVAGTTASPIAGRYAVALYEVADDARALDEVVDQADALGRLIDQSPPLRDLLADPVRDIAQARAAVLAVLEAQGFGDILRRFVGTVANNRRLRDLRPILAGFAALVADRRGIVTAEVVSAHRLSDLQRAQLLARLAQAGYGRVSIQERVESALLGGLVVRVGARLYDASLRSRLERLHHAMKDAS